MMFSPVLIKELTCMLIDVRKRLHEYDMMYILLFHTALLIVSFKYSRVKAS